MRHRLKTNKQTSKYFAFRARTTRIPGRVTDVRLARVKFERPGYIAIRSVRGKSKTMATWQGK